MRKTLTTLALASLCVFGAMAHAGTSPAIHITDTGVAYASGGIGSDESAMMRSASRDWPATFEFAVRDGKRNDFVADVLVSVRDAAGKPVLDNVLAKGPFMLTRLDPGRYQVQATLGGRTLTQRIEVQKGSPARTVFVWPAGTDTRGPA
jgi:hypothetical protein